MATQTGSIDLRGANSAKLYVDDEAGEIRSEVSETYATKTEIRRTDSGSGAVVSSDDAANLPPLSLTIHGKSVQDGTPSPSNPVPIESVEPTSGTSISLVLSDGTTTAIDLQGYALRSLPDGTEDTLEVDGEGNVTLTKRVGSYTVTGSEAIASSAALGEYYRIVLHVLQGAVATASSDNGRCSAVIYKADWAGQYEHVYANTYNIQFYAKASTAADALAAFVGAEVLYPLATPQTISLGKIDLPPLPSPSFSMHVDALVTPTIDAEWWTQGGEEVGSVYQRTSALEQDVDGLTLELSEKVDSSEEWVSWLHAGTDATTHEPYLAMGKNSAYPSVVYGSDAARFYDGEGDAASNVVASFGTEGVTVGKDGSANTAISDSDIVFHDADGNEAGKISMSSEGAVPASASHTITANTSQQSYTLEGLAPLPDFTLGNLVVDLLVNGTVVRKYNFTSISEAEFSVSIDTTTDATFTAAQSGDTWGATMTAQYRVQGATADITFSLSWVYRGTAPMYEFGTTENTGAYSFSAGTGLVAAGQSQAVFGTYNIPSSTDLFILGNGTSDGNRSNALKVDSQGTLETSGYFQLGGNVGLGTVAQQGWLTALFGMSFVQSGTYSGTVNVTSSWYGMYYGTVTIPITARVDTSYNVQATATCSGNLVWCSLNSKSTSSFELFVISPRNNAQTVTIDWMIYG